MYTELIVGVDASRNHSGGAKGHLIGTLTGADPRLYGIKSVHLWAYQSLSDAVPERPWLTKHVPPILGKSLIHQAWWQYHSLPREAKASGCEVMFNTDAGSVCPFQPSVTLSQDMLSYEPGEINRFGISLARLRLELLRLIQNNSLKTASRAMFLTKHAATVIQNVTGPLESHVVVPHGIDDRFRQNPETMDRTQDSRAEVKILYISNAALYKHQWNVVRAVSSLRDSGVNASLLLVGGGQGRAQRILDREIALCDPKRTFVKQEPFVKHNEIACYLAKADLFVFASSCENLPITLLEAMASGLPIACSDRGPMPEVLQDGGIYFNPEDSSSVAAAIESIIVTPGLKSQIALRAKELSNQYSWQRCAKETWDILSDCAKQARAA